MEFGTQRSQSSGTSYLVPVDVCQVVEVVQREGGVPLGQVQVVSLRDVKAHAHRVVGGLQGDDQPRVHRELPRQVLRRRPHAPQPCADVASLSRRSSWFRQVHHTVSRMGNRSPLATHGCDSGALATGCHAGMFPPCVALRCIALCCVMLFIHWKSGGEALLPLVIEGSEHGTAVVAVGMWLSCWRLYCAPHVRPRFGTACNTPPLPPLPVSPLYSPHRMKQWNHFGTRAAGREGGGCPTAATAGGKSGCINGKQAVLVRGESPAATASGLVEKVMPSMRCSSNQKSAAFMRPRVWKCRSRALCSDSSGGAPRSKCQASTGSLSAVYMPSPSGTPGNQPS